MDNVDELSLGNLAIEANSNIPHTSGIVERNKVVDSGEMEASLLVSVSVNEPHASEEVNKTESVDNLAALKSNQNLGSRYDKPDTSSGIIVSNNALAAGGAIAISGISNNPSTAVCVERAVENSNPKSVVAIGTHRKAHVPKFSAKNGDPVDPQIPIQQVQQKTNKTSELITFSDSDDEVIMWVDKPAFVNLVSSDDDDESSSSPHDLGLDTKVNVETKSGADSSGSNERKDHIDSPDANNQRNAPSFAKTDIATENEVITKAVVKPKPNNTEVHASEVKEVEGMTKSPDLSEIITSPDYSSASPDFTVASVVRVVTPAMHATATASAAAAASSSNQGVASPNRSTASTAMPNSPLPKSIRRRRSVKRPHDQSENFDSSESIMIELSENRISSIRTGNGKEYPNRRPKKIRFSDSDQVPDKIDFMAKDVNLPTIENSSHRISFLSKWDAKANRRDRHVRERKEKTDRRHRHGSGQHDDTNDDSRHTSGNRSRSPADFIRLTSNPFRPMESRTPVDHHRNIVATVPSVARKSDDYLAINNVDETDRMEKRRELKKPELPVSSSVVGNDARTRNDAMSLNITKKDGKTLLSTEKGFNFLEQAYAKYRVKIRIEWTAHGKTVVVNGTKSDQSRFVADLSDFLNGTTGINGFTFTLPKNRDSLVRILNENLDLLKRRAGNVDQMFGIMCRNEDMATKSSIKTANRVRKELNVILFGQAGLRDGRMHLAALKRNFQTVLDQEHYVVPLHIHEQMELHFNYIFSSSRHTDYRSLIREYNILNEPKYYPASSTGPSLEGTKMLVLKPVEYDQPYSSNATDSAEKTGARRTDA